MKDGGYKRATEKLNLLRRWVHRFPRIRRMWSIKDEELGKHWELRLIAREVQVADEANFDYRLRVVDNCLIAEIVERPGDPPV